MSRNGIPRLSVRLILAAWSVLAVLGICGWVAVVAWFVHHWAAGCPR